MKNKKSLSLALLLTTLNISSGDYVIQVQKESYKNRITIENVKSQEEYISPDINNELNLIEVTDSQHELGGGWYLFSEGNQSNFETLVNFDTLVESDHTSFVLYSSDDLYLVFNRKLDTRDGSNAHGTILECIFCNDN